jgi:hypothetical protein
LYHENDLKITSRLTFLEKLAPSKPPKHSIPPVHNINRRMLGYFAAIGFANTAGCHKLRSETYEVYEAMISDLPKQYIIPELNVPISGRRVDAPF